MALNTICHVEWQVTDFGKAKEFYGGLFGWKFEEFGPEYMMFSTPDSSPEGGPGGGFAKVDSVSAGKSPVVYMVVDDVVAYGTKATALGGTVVLGKTSVGGDMGFISIFADPFGNTVGVFQSAH